MSKLDASSPEYYYYVQIKANLFQSITKIGIWDNNTRRAEIRKKY